MWNSGKKLLYGIIITIKQYINQIFHVVAKLVSLKIYKDEKKFPKISIV